MWNSVINYRLVVNMPTISQVFLMAILVDSISLKGGKTLWVMAEFLLTTALGVSVPIMVMDFTIIITNRVIITMNTVFQ